MSVTRSKFRLSLGGGLIILFVALIVASVAGMNISPWLMAAPVVAWAILTVFRVIGALRHERDMRLLAAKMEIIHRGN